MKIKVALLDEDDGIVLEAIMPPHGDLREGLRVACDFIVIHRESNPYIARADLTVEFDR